MDVGDLALRESVFLVDVPLPPSVITGWASPTPAAASTPGYMGATASSAQRGHHGQMVRDVKRWMQMLRMGSRVGPYGQPINDGSQPPTPVSRALISAAGTRSVSPSSDVGRPRPPSRSRGQMVHDGRVFRVFECIKASDRRSQSQQRPWHLGRRTRVAPLGGGVAESSFENGFPVTVSPEVMETLCGGSRGFVGGFLLKPLRKKLVTAVCLPPREVCPQLAKLLNDRGYLIQAHAGRTSSTVGHFRARVLEESEGLDDLTTQVDGLANAVCRQLEQVLPRLLGEFSLVEGIGFDSELLAASSTRNVAEGSRPVLRYKEAYDALLVLAHREYQQEHLSLEELRAFIALVDRQLLHFIYRPIGATELQELRAATLHNLPGRRLTMAPERRRDFMNRLCDRAVRATRRPRGAVHPRWLEIALHRNLDEMEHFHQIWHQDALEWRSALYQGLQRCFDPQGSRWSDEFPVRYRACLAHLNTMLGEHHAQGVTRRVMGAAEETVKELSWPTAMRSAGVPADADAAITAFGAAVLGELPQGDEKARARFMARFAQSLGENGATMFGREPPAELPHAHYQALRRLFLAAQAIGRRREVLLTRSLALTHRPPRTKARGAGGK